MTSDPSNPAPPEVLEIERSGIGQRVDVVEIEGRPHIAITFGEDEGEIALAMEPEGAAVLAAAIAKAVQIALKIDAGAVAAEHPANSRIIVAH